MATSWSLACLVERLAQEIPWHALATDGARTWTYAQVDADASALAAAFSELGLGAGDRIAVHLPNGVEWITTMLAAARLGVVIVPVSPQLGFHELRYQLRHAEVSAVVTIEQWNGVDHLQRFEELLGDLPNLLYVVSVGEEELWHDDRIFRFEHLISKGSGSGVSLPSPPASGDDTVDLVLMYTSGTMGKPKAVELSHRAVVANAVNTAAVLGVTSQDRVLTLVPFGNIVGFSAMIGAMTGGATIVLQSPVDMPDALALMTATQTTVLVGVPLQYHLLMRDPDFEPSRLRSLRTGLMVGSASGEALVRRVRRWCDVLLGYGLTETGGMVTLTRPGDTEDRRLNSVGCPLAGVEVMTMDIISGEMHGPEAVGELAVRGPYLMRGYLRMPAGTARAFTPEGFFLTGDIGIVDEDGCVRILGRTQETITRGGLQLYPRELEDRLRTHPAVEDVCVIGVPHDVMGELACACIVAVEGAVITGEEIRRYARDTMTVNLVPDLVRFFDAFPLTGSGKVRRRELARAIALSANALSASALQANALDHPVSF